MSSLSWQNFNEQLHDSNDINYYFQLPDIVTRFKQCKFGGEYKVQNSYQISL